MKAAGKTSLHALACGFASILIASCTTTVEPGHEVCRNRTGFHDGFYFTFWKDGGAACMAMGPKGRYSTRYDLAGAKNLVAGKGWRTGSVDRKIGYRASFDPGANSYLTLYGWSVNPLTEYYVVESWGSAFRPPGSGAAALGTVESDGGSYQIYRTERVQQPSIRGIRTFRQYWSVRTERRAPGADGSITFSNHVAAWERLGMRLGKMHYQVMATEGFGSSGRSDVTVREIPQEPR